MFFNLFDGGVDKSDRWSLFNGLLFSIILNTCINL